MLGAIVGDVVGSPFEFDANRRIAHSRQYTLVLPIAYATDDSIMTLAMAEAVMNSIPHYGDSVKPEVFRSNCITSMQAWGRKFPRAGYGTRFRHWLRLDNPQPYGSWGNGSAMRVSPVAWAFSTLEDVEKFAEISASVTHNHPEGIKGAQATASAIFLARTGKSKQEIKSYIKKKYDYDLDKTLDEIRPNYHHVESCQETVPEAIIAFLEGETFEDVIRGAVSLSGDADTLTAIAGSIAEGYFGIPESISRVILPKLEYVQKETLRRFDEWRQDAYPE